MKDFKKKSFGKKNFGARPGYRSKGAPTSFGPRPYDPNVERFQAICNECKATCEVPFKPNGKKPVYCRNCFKGKEDSVAFGGVRESRREASTPAPDFSKQLDALGAKLDRIIAVLEVRA